MHIVLFVCEGNIFRSQIAEAAFRARAADDWAAASAGTRVRREAVHPGAVELMREIGIRMDGQKPKPLTPEALASATRVIAICDGVDGERWPVIDPADLPEARWREIRDDLLARVDGLIERLIRLDEKR
jgi:arsenate reductase (thioredoxin)